MAFTISTPRPPGRMPFSCRTTVEPRAPSGLTAAECNCLWGMQEFDACADSQNDTGKQNQSPSPDKSPHTRLTQVGGLLADRHCIILSTVRFCSDFSRKDRWARRFVTVFRQKSPTVAPYQRRPQCMCKTECPRPLSEDLIWPGRTRARVVQWERFTGASWSHRRSGAETWLQLLSM